MASNSLLGIVFAVAATICFAGNRALPSKALIDSNPETATYVSLVTGVLVTGGAAIALGPITSWLSLTATVVIVFSAVGVLNFAIAHQFFYSAGRTFVPTKPNPLHYFQQS